LGAAEKKAQLGVKTPHCAAKALRIVERISGYFSWISAGQGGVFTGIQRWKARFAEWLVSQLK
jgi:hypothetical protein